MSRIRGPGPDPRSLVVLVVAALALVATSPAPPTLDGRVIGQVVLGGREAVDRELRIHVDPAGGGASTGSISLGFQAASGLQAGYANDATIRFVRASDGAATFAPNTAFPIDRCLEGCDLTYTIRITAGRDVLPASVIRYEVGVRLQYASGFGTRDPALMRLDLDGQATGPVAPSWSVLAGVLALLGGLVVGPTVDRSLGRGRRRWPAIGLVALALGQIAWMTVEGAASLADYAARAGVRPSPDILLAIVDPWSAALLGVLAWGVWRGLRRWPDDGGHLLGLATVAMVGLGGLWLAWWSTWAVVVQPVALAIPFVLLGALGGMVIAQAWRTDPRARHDRWWAGLAVLGHGVVIAGFGFLAEQSLYDPFSETPTSFLALIPAALVAVAFRRWLRGRIVWLVLFDVLIAAAGVLGLWLWSSSLVGLSSQAGRPDTADVGIAIAVAAAIVAFGTSLHTLRGPSSGEGHPPAIDARVAASLSPPAPLSDDPPTT